MNQIDPSLLRTWYKVAQTRSLQAAAKTLHITQPAISHQLKRLQEWLQAPLYQRTSRGIEPTHVGHQLAHIAEDMELAMLKAWTLRNDTLAMLNGSLRIYASHTHAEFFLPAITSEYLNIHPSISLQLFTMNSRDAWRHREQADLIFIENSNEILHGLAEWIIQPLLETEIAVMVPPQESLYSGQTIGSSSDRVEKG